MHRLFHLAEKKSEDGRTHLYLEGNLDAEHVAVLDRVVEEGMGVGGAGFILHCGGLRTADDRGVSRLLRLRLSGAELRDVPLLIQWKLTMMKTPSHLNS